MAKKNETPWKLSNLYLQISLKSVILGDPAASQNEGRIAVFTRSFYTFTSGIWTLRCPKSKKTRFEHFLNSRYQSVFSKSVTFFTKKVKKVIFSVFSWSNRQIQRRNTIFHFLKNSVSAFIIDVSAVKSREIIQLWWLFSGVKTLFRFSWILILC